MNEHGYSVADDTASEVEVGDFLYGLIRLCKPYLVVETGCYLGHTTERMGQACYDNGNSQVVSCDVNPDFVLAAREKCNGLPVCIWNEESLRLAELLRADLVFSDSATQTMRMQEFELCKAGCIFVVHDTWGHGAEHNKTLANWVTYKFGVNLLFGRGIGMIRK